MTASLTHSELSNARSTQESLRVLFFQIEAELHRSDAFRQAMSGVQQQTGNSEGMQALLKAAGREAIRLAMRQMLRHAPKAEPVSTKRDKRSEKREEAAAESTLLNTAASIEPEPITPLVEPQVTTRPAPPPASPFEQQRQVAIEQVGEALREARYAKGMSIEQLHSQTWVPIHQLKALEAGQVEQLPEDIFVRGFIRRVGDALGLDGGEMADSLPTLDAAKSVLPSWARSRVAPSAQTCLQPAHLYVGYAALMAGAVGSLAWITQHPVSPGVLEKLEPEPPAPEQQTRPGVRFSQAQQRAIVAQAIAQPQMVTPNAGL